MKPNKQAARSVSGGLLSFRRHRRIRAIDCLVAGRIGLRIASRSGVDGDSQAVYGKNHEGKIIGRCLIALNSRGEVLRFRSYAHEHLDDFDTAVEVFIDQLTADMGTKRGDSGDVTELVATRWYDDGVVGSANSPLQSVVSLSLQELARVAFEPELSTQERWHFRELLAKCLEEHDLSEFMSRMPRRDRFLKPLPYPDWILETLLDFTERDRSVENQLLVAELSADLGRNTIAVRALECMSAKQWIPRFKRSVCDEPKCFAFHNIGSPTFVSTILTQMDATSGLRLLRASRKRSVSSDHDEVCSDRRRLLADLHERLGRHRLAQELRLPVKQRKSIL